MSNEVDWAQLKNAARIISQPPRKLQTQLAADLTVN